MMWTHQLVKDWTQKAGKSDEPHVKKQRLIHCPPILIVVEPAQGERPGKVRFLINDTFSDNITASIGDANTVCIEGVHTPLAGNNSGLRREDDIPRGAWKRTLRVKEQMDASVPPVPQDCNGLGGIFVSLAGQGLKNDLVPLARSQMRIANWLVRGTQDTREPQDGTQHTWETQDES